MNDNDVHLCTCYYNTFSIRMTSSIVIFFSQKFRRMIPLHTAHAEVSFTVQLRNGFAVMLETEKRRFCAHGGA
jgi:hypothetical protein